MTKSERQAADYVKELEAIRASQVPISDMTIQELRAVVQEHVDRINALEVQVLSLITQLNRDWLT